MLKSLFLSTLLILTLGAFPKAGFPLGDAGIEAFDDSLVGFHTPIYPRSGRTVTFNAIANHASGIKKIRFWVDLYQLGVDRDGDITYTFRGRWDSDDTGHSCNFSSPYPANATCAFPFNSRNRWVEINNYAIYTVAMRDGDNNLHWDRKIRADMKLVGRDILAARDWAPRIYRRGKKSEKFNVIIVADDSFGNQNTFLSMLEQLVPQGLLKQSPPTHLDRYRRFFNIYMNHYNKRIEDTYSNPPSDGCSNANLNDLSDEIPNQDDLTWADDFIIAHQPSLQDCSQAGYSTADDNNVVVHELMHSLFRLRDEYADSAGREAIGPHKNVYAANADCSTHGTGSHAADFAASPGCRTLGTRSDRTANSGIHWCPAGDIMVSNSSSLSTEEHAQILDYIGDGNLSAFSSPPTTVRREVTPPRGFTPRGVRQTATPATPSQSQLQEKALIAQITQEALKDDQMEEKSEKQQKTLILKVQVSDEGIKLLNQKIAQGPAAHIFFPKIQRDFLVSLVGREGQILKEFWVQDPRDIDDEKPAEGEISGPPPAVGTLRIKAPFDAGIAKVVVKDKSGQTLLNVTPSLK